MVLTRLFSFILISGLALFSICTVYLTIYHLYVPQKHLSSELFFDFNADDAIARTDLSKVAIRIGQKYRLYVQLVAPDLPDLATRGNVMLEMRAFSEEGTIFMESKKPVREIHFSS